MLAMAAEERRDEELRLRQEHDVIRADVIPDLSRATLAQSGTRTTLLELARFNGVGRNVREF